jgi:acid phosphatase
MLEVLDELEVLRGKCLTCHHLRQQVQDTAVIIEPSVELVEGDTDATTIPFGDVSETATKRVLVAVNRAICVKQGSTFHNSCVAKFDLLVKQTKGDEAPEVCFTTIGDWGEPRDDQLKVAKTMSEVVRRRMVKFVVSTGDNFYPIGVQSVADPHWIQTFEIPFSSRFVQNLRWYISPGNHDQWGLQPQKEYMEQHPRWYFPNFHYFESVPLFRDQKKRSNESIELFVYNSAGREPRDQHIQGDDFFGSVSSRHGEGRGGDLAHHWRMVVNHEPMFSGGMHGLIQERNQFIREMILPTIQQYMVHAYFNGDDHFLEIHRANGTDYFTSGGGGGSSKYQTSNRPTTQWNILDGDFSPLGIMLHCLRGDTMRTTVVDEKGSVMTTYLTKYFTNATEFMLPIEK